MDRRYVGIDLHRRRSVIYAMDAQGDRLFRERISNDSLRLLEVVGAAGVDAEVVIEATYGWYWAVDLLREAGFSVHLAHPSGNDWGNWRVKNDECDARDLADLLRLGRLAEAWIAPPSVREARELVRYRAKLVQLRSGLKAQVHAVMAKEGIVPGVTDMFGPKGQQLLDAMKLADAYVVRVESLRDLIEGHDWEVVMLERRIHERLRDDRGDQAIQALDGVGRTIAAIFVTQIGDVTRFRSAEALCSWAGLTPRHRESDTKVVRGKITKQGSKLVRWVALEAIVRYHGGPPLREHFHRVAERRGTNKARIATARRLMTLVTTGRTDAWQPSCTLTTTPWCGTHERHHERQPSPSIGRARSRPLDKPRSFTDAALLRRRAVCASRVPAPRCATTAGRLRIGKCVVLASPSAVSREDCDRDPAMTPRGDSHDRHASRRRYRGEPRHRTRGRARAG